MCREHPLTGFIAAEEVDQARHGCAIPSGRCLPEGVQPTLWIRGAEPNFSSRER